MIVIAPVLISLFFGVLLYLLPKERKIQALFALTGAALLVLTSGQLLSLSKKSILTYALGAWSAPFGIIFVADPLAGLLCLASALLFLFVVIHAMGSFKERELQSGAFSLMFFLFMGVSGAFLTGDLFNLYVWYEVLLISSFVLLAVGGTVLHFEATLKYLALNLISSVLFLCSLGFLFAITGKLNMADLAFYFQKAEADNYALLLAAFLFLGFAIKAALFPFFFWLTASYHTLHPALGALFAGLLTKVGVYSLLRVFTLIFPDELLFFKPYLLALAGLAMLVGGLGALAQTELRRMLAFSSVGQVGYMIVGVALSSISGFAATVFFVIHHLFVKSALFLWSGSIEQKGILKRQPFVALGFAICALALLGFPPFLGFYAKLSLIRAAVEQNLFQVVILTILASIIGILYLFKFWNEFFLSKSEQNEIRVPQGFAVSISLLLITGFICYLSLRPEELLALSRRIGEDLSSPQNYIQAVLSGRKIP